MKRFKRILATMLALVCVLAVFPTMEAEAGIVTVNGGCTTIVELVPGKCILHYL